MCGVTIGAKAMPKIYKENAAIGASGKYVLLPDGLKLKSATTKFKPAV
jgi:hypothetical protein